MWPEKKFVDELYSLHKLVVVFVSLHTELLWDINDA